METERPETQPSPIPEDQAPESTEEVVVHEHIPVNLSTGGPPQPDELFSATVEVPGNADIVASAGMTDKRDHARHGSVNRSSNAKRQQR